MYDDSCVLSRDKKAMHKVFFWTTDFHPLEKDGGIRVYRLYYAIKSGSITAITLERVDTHYTLLQSMLC